MLNNDKLEGKAERRMTTTFNQQSISLHIELHESRAVKTAVFHFLSPTLHVIDAWKTHHQSLSLISQFEGNTGEETRKKTKRQIHGNNHIPRLIEDDVLLPMKAWSRKETLSFCVNYHRLQTKKQMTKAAMISSRSVGNDDLGILYYILSSQADADESFESSRVTSLPRVSSKSVIFILRTLILSRIDSPPDT